MLGVNYLPDRYWLSLIAMKEGQASTEFYMPGMSTDGECYFASKSMGRSQLGFYKTQNLDSDVTFQIHGKVTNVSSGDSLTVEFDEQKFVIQLWGVVAPSPHEKFCDESREYLTELCKDQEVIIYCRHQNDNRQFAGVVELNGEYINHRMIGDGYAQADRNEGWSVDIKNLEDEAKRLSKGLWAQGWSKIQ